MPFSLTERQLLGFTHLGNAAKSLHQTTDALPKASELAAAARRLFEGEAGRLAQTYVVEAAKDEGVDADAALQFWRMISSDVVGSIEQGTFFDLIGNPADALRLVLLEMNVGALGVGANGALVLAQEGEIPFPLADGESPIDKNSPLGKALRIIDVVLELVGVLLLLANVVMPKVNWARIIEILNERREFGFLETILEELTILGEMIAKGLDKKEILKKIIEILKKLWNIESVWAVIKAGLEDMHWYDWALLIAKFIGLTALEVAADSLSAGAATGIKIGVILAGGGQVALKISRLA